MATKKQKKVKLTKAYYHEACDRTYCLQAMIEELLSKHPVIMQSKELKNKIEEAQSILWEAYQATGAKM